MVNEPASVVLRIGARDDGNGPAGQEDYRPTRRLTGRPERTGLAAIHIAVCTGRAQKGQIGDVVNPSVGGQGGRGLGRGSRS